MKPERICIGCEYWQPDPEAFDRRDHLLAQIAAKIVTKEELNTLFGVCKATYLDKKGNLQLGSLYLSGTLGGFKCGCKDNRGKILFKALEEGR